jgi:dTDP-4-amino-4,6-dideoxygalactose transaminase
MHKISIPYSKPVISDEEAESVKQQLLSGNIATGQIVAEFEKALCDYCQADHAVVVSSGSAALHLASLVAGIDHKSHIVTTPITFVSTVLPAVRAGAKISLLDIDRQTAMPDPDALEDFLRKNNDVSHFISVSFAGNGCFVENYDKICSKFNVIHIADNAHGLGGFTQSGHPITSPKFSDLSILSFQATKQITTGEGGAILTNNSDLANKLHQLRTLGITKSEDLFSEDSHGAHFYESLEAGFNYRLTDFQAVLGMEQLKRLDDRQSQRRKIVQTYQNAFENSEKVKLLGTDAERDALHLTIARIENRNATLDLLREKGFGVQVHYIPLYYHSVFKDYSFFNKKLPETERFYQSALSLPLFPGLSEEAQQKVIAILLTQT